MIKLIIFDIDGTLVNAYPAIVASFNHAMRCCGYPARSAAVIRRAVGRGDVELLRPFVASRDLRKVLRAYRAHHAGALIEKARLYPGARSLLIGLKERGIMLAVASNRPTRFSRLLLRHVGIRDFFQRVLCKDAVRFGKPHPQILLSIMRACGVSRQETLYVGDMVIDAQAARRAGVKAVMVTTGSSTRAELKHQQPYLVLPRLTLGRFRTIIRQCTEL